MCICLGSCVCVCVRARACVLMYFAPKYVPLACPGVLECHFALSRAMPFRSEGGLLRLPAASPRSPSFTRSGQGSFGPRLAPKSAGPRGSPAARAPRGFLGRARGPAADLLPAPPRRGWGSAVGGRLGALSGRGWGWVGGVISSGTGGWDRGLRHRGRLSRETCVSYATHLCNAPSTLSRSGERESDGHLAMGRFWGCLAHGRGERGSPAPLPAEPAVGWWWAVRVGWRRSRPARTRS
jgi:hypothetical protein